MSSSEAHNMKNLNMSVAESLVQMEQINNLAREHGVRVRSYIATSFGCPMQGAIPVELVVDIARKLESYGSYEVSLGDTTGMASPDLVFKVVDAVKRSLHKIRSRSTSPLQRHRVRECACITAGGHRCDRQRRGRTGRMSVRPGGDRKHGYRGFGRHAASHGHRDGDRS